MDWYSVIVVKGPQLNRELCLFYIQSIAAPQSYDGIVHDHLNDLHDSGCDCENDHYKSSHDHDYDYGHGYSTDDHGRVQYL